MSCSFRALGGAIAVGLVAAGLAVSSAGGAPVASCHGPTSQPPNVGSRNNTLDGVAVTSACNAWAVGYYGVSRGAPRPLIEHWNGGAWKVQASPIPRAGFSELLGVAASSAKNAWAVGYYGGGSKFQRTLIEHWNGKSWKVQPSPSPRSVSVLSGVVATSAKNAWAVGGEGTMYGPGGKTLAGLSGSGG